MEDLDLILQQYVATANNPEYNLDWDVINSKFPELAEYDPIALQQYVATANNPKYGKDWGVINAKFPELGYGIVEKPKTSEDAIRSVSNIKKGIDKNDPEVISAIAEKYFNLDNLKRERTPFPMAGTPLFDLRDDDEKYVNDLETDLKNYFEKTTTDSWVDWNTGETKHFARETGDFSKYEQYKEYQDTRVFNLDWVDESTISNAVEHRQEQKVHQYIQNIDDDEVQKSAEIAAEEIPSGIFGEDEGHELHRFVQALKRDRESVEKAKSARVSKLRVFSPGSMELEAKAGGEAQKVLNTYVTKKQKQLERDIFNFENDSKTFEETRDKYQPEITKLEQDLEALGEVNEYSSAEEIAKYNEIATKTNSIIEKFTKETEGLNIMERQVDLLSRFKKHEQAISKITEADKIAKAFALDYSFSERALLSMEKAIIGDMGGIVLGTLAGIAGISEKIAGALGDEETNEPVIEYFKNAYAASIDYNESLSNHKESSLPLTTPWKDVRFPLPFRDGKGSWKNIGEHNIGEVSQQLFANNSFSILSALTYGAAIKAGMKVIPASRALMRTFFAVEGGAKLSKMEIAQKNATESIKWLEEEALPSATTQDERLEILEQISDQDKALNVSQVKKAFTTILYGGIAAYAERLGTMGYVRRLNTMIKGVSRPSIKNTIKGAGAFTLNSGIEYIEEFVTQVGHNLVDVGVLDQNKSLIAGIDAEFNMNVLFSTMAIQTPSTGTNIYNSITNEISSRKDIAEKRKIRDRVVEWLNVLEKDNKRPKGKRLLSNDDRTNIENTINRLLKKQV